MGRSHFMGIAGVLDGPAGSFLAALRHLFEQNAWIKYVLEIFFLVAAAAAVRIIALRLLRRWTGDSQVKHKNLIALVQRLVTPALAIGVVAACFNLFPLSGKLLTVLNRFFYITILALGMYCAAKIALIFLNQWLENSEGRKSLREPTQFAVRVLFATFGTMILLENLGISLTSVWTTLGVGSVAVALALQDTLSNFFAGIYLRLDNPVGIGDYIKLESGEEGFVLERGWRSTRIKALSNNMIVIPNAKLASTIVTNFSLPDPHLSLLIPISVNLNSDPQRVEDILVEESSKALGTIPGLLSDSPPCVRFIPGFGQNSLDFTLICTVGTYVDQYLVQHELRMRIYNRLRGERIAFPVVQSAVHVFADDGNHDAAVSSLHSGKMQSGSRQ